MSKYLQDNAEISDGVNLLISILVRYPEIATIHIDPVNHGLKLSFIIKSQISNEQSATLKKLLLDSIQALHMLKKLTSQSAEIEFYNYDNLSIITIIRDVASLTKNEINLVIAILREKFAELLSSDNNIAIPEEDLIMQDELIEDMLANMQQDHGSNRLIGIREDGRVLVFNK